MAREFYSADEDFTIQGHWCRPGETTSLALSRTGQRDELQDDLPAWIERVPATLPGPANPAWKTEDTCKSATKKSKRKD